MKLHLLLPPLLVAAAAGRAAMRWLRLPAVVGEILAGVLLGPHLIGLIPADGAGPTDHETIQELAQVGLCMLLFRVGLETHLTQLRPVAAPASRLAIAGMLVPFALGWGVMSAVGAASSAAVFIGAALTATGIGVTVSVLAEPDAESSPESTVILGAAILDDVLGLVLLAVLVGLATPGMSPVFASGKAVLQAVGFLSAALVLGKPIATAPSTRHPERDWIEAQLAPLVNLLTPLFFVFVGASIEFGGLDPFSPVGRQNLVSGLLLLIVAAGGKMLAAWFTGAPGLNRWVLRSGMMPQG